MSRPRLSMTPEEKKVHDLKRRRESRARCAASNGKEYAPRPEKPQTPEERRIAMVEWKRKDRLRRAGEQGRPIRIRAGLHDAHVKVWLRTGGYYLRKRAERPILHDTHVRLFKSDAIQYKWRYANDAEFALKERLRRQMKKKSALFPQLGDLMREAIRRGGSSNQVEAVCGYTIKDLAQHLERQFTKDMNWDMFMTGQIHIDHIIPQSLFDLTNMDDVAVCWSLANLRPMKARDNISKSDKRVSLC